jgi:hypothetical protein
MGRKYTQRRNRPVIDDAPPAQPGRLGGGRPRQPARIARPAGEQQSPDLEVPMN